MLKSHEDPDSIVKEYTKESVLDDKYNMMFIHRDNYYRLKVVLLPVSLLLLLIKVIFKLAERASEIVIGLLILIVGSGIVYSLIMHQWKNLLIFAIVGGGIIAAMFMCVVVEETCDELREKISKM